MSCTICTEQFDQTRLPKVLTCGHTFCKDCISGWFKSQQDQYSVPRGTVQCPMCRRNTPLPASGDDGVAALPTNFALLELVEESEEASVGDGSDVSKTACSIHTGKALEFSCETCSGELVCGLCVKSKHQPAAGHRIINLSTAMEREQKEKAKLQRKVLELQQQNSELTCSTSFAMSKANPFDYGRTKLNTSLAQLMEAKKLLKTNLSQGKSSSSDSGLVSNPDQETAAVGKADGAVLDEVQNAQAKLEQTSSPSSQLKTALSSSEKLNGQSPYNSSLSGKPKILPKPARRSRPNSAVLSPSTQQNTTVSSSEGPYGPIPFDSSLSRKPNTLPKPVQRSRPHSVAAFGPNSPQNTEVNSSEDLYAPTPSNSSLSGRSNTLPITPQSQQNTAVHPPQLQFGASLRGGSTVHRNPSARSLQSNSPIYSHGSTGSSHSEETDTEMLSARNKLAMVLQSSLRRSPQP